MSVEDQTEELLAFVKLAAIRIRLRAYESTPWSSIARPWAAFVAAAAA